MGLLCFFESAHTPWLRTLTDWDSIGGGGGGGIRVPPKPPGTKMVLLDNSGKVM